MMSRLRAGFTLVEMAMVLVIIGLIMLTVFPALNAVRSANQRALTQSNLHSLMLATAAYVQANGCLPCPANAGASGANFGRLGTSAACGTCSAPQGIPPFVALGVPASTAHDGWGHWITMRVDPALTVLPVSAASVFVPPSAACTQTDLASGLCVSAPCSVATVANGTCNAVTTGQFNVADKGLCRNLLSQAAGAAPITVTTPPSGSSQHAAVIFVSHGSNGYGSCFAEAQASSQSGSRLPFPPGMYANCSASGGYAVCNAGAGSGQCAAGNTVFYDAPTVTSDFDPYDDILAYADRNSLVSMLGNIGCQTVW